MTMMKRENCEKRKRKSNAAVEIETDEQVETISQPNYTYGKKWCLKGNMFTENTVWFSYFSLNEQNPHIYLGWVEWLARLLEWQYEQFCYSFMRNKHTSTES